METLINFFSGIGDFIVSAFKYIVDTVSGLAYCVRLLSYFVEKIPEYFGWLPAEFVVIIGCVFSIAIIYKVLGREG